VENVIWSEAPEVSENDGCVLSRGIAATPVQPSAWCKGLTPMEK
jgi:hypothetical protein